jgi:hypothetical protein
VVRFSCGITDKSSESLAEIELSKRLARGLAFLTQAANFATQTHGDLWEFAAEIHHLYELGLSNNDLRYLVKLRVVEFAREVTAPS